MSNLKIKTTFDDDVDDVFNFYDDDYKEFDITYNDTYGDMQIIWMGDDIDFELKCLRQSYWHREITRFDHDLEAGMIDQFYDEFVQLRTNEYEKWFI